MLLGGEDPIIDPAANRRYFDAYGGADKTLVMPPELRHNLLVELGREQVYRRDRRVARRPARRRGPAVAGHSDAASDRAICETMNECGPGAAVPGNW